MSQKKRSYTFNIEATRNGFIVQGMLLEEGSQAPIRRELEHAKDEAGTTGAIGAIFNEFLKAP